MSAGSIEEVPSGKVKMEYVTSYIVVEDAPPGRVCKQEVLRRYRQV